MCDRIKIQNEIVIFLCGFLSIIVFVLVERTGKKIFPDLRVFQILNIIIIVRLNALKERSRKEVILLNIFQIPSFKKFMLKSFVYFEMFFLVCRLDLRIFCKFFGISYLNYYVFYLFKHLFKLNALIQLIVQKAQIQLAPIIILWNLEVLHISHNITLNHATTRLCCFLFCQNFENKKDAGFFLVFLQTQKKRPSLTFPKKPTFTKLQIFMEIILIIFSLIIMVNVNIDLNLIGNFI
eukprot:TRINITY_DN20692_c0_g1_i2.p3 TRINITY_DN20692_c0_g1~~TRINITY_DN20692_c0_g1_i2.p3  ORF type:complete len:237 (+),score=-0.45 TRINITY_DN20692_c0_g1_i2:323-1033(+)